MKRILLLALMSISTVACADNYGWIGEAGIQQVKETSGPTVCYYPTILKVTNNTLTCNADGSASIDTGSGGGATTITNTQVAYSNGSNLVGSTSLTYNSSTGALTATSFNTPPNNSPQTQFYPILAGDTHWIWGMSSNGTGTNDDPIYLSEGTTIGSSNRISVAPGGLVTIPAGLALSTGGITMTGSIAATGARVTKGWFTDLEVTNAPTVSGTSMPTVNNTLTLTNKRITKRDVTVTQSATPTINTDNTDHAHITALAQAITSFTTNLSGTPVAGDTLWIDITDNGTARALTFGTSFEASTVALPTTTVISTRLDIGFVWNEVTSKWRCVGVS